MARRGGRDGGVPVRSRVRDALPDLRLLVSPRGHRADALRRVCEHRVLAAVAVAARSPRLSRSVRRARRPEPGRMPAAASRVRPFRDARGGSAARGRQ